MNHTLVPDELDVLVELLPTPGTRVIELGCGGARMARQMLQRWPDMRYLGLEVDLRQHAINLQDTPPRMRFAVGGAQAIACDDAQFDLALMLKSLHHVPLDVMDQALTEVARVLRPGGHLYVSEPVYEGALNEIVPQAIALMSADQRPVVVHQSGAAQIDALRANYAAAGVEAELTPFIDDTASAFAAADIIVCRAGASTVTEIAAVGAASIFVPFPSAVDDHQTTNAQFLVNAGGGWLVQQRDLTPQGLSEMLLKLERSTLVDVALKAKNMQKINATREVVTACEELA